MAPPDEYTLPPEIDAHEERRSSSSARRHVGAAGLTQLDILDKIIDAGREQLVVTQVLREVVASTLDQQRATPLAQVGTLAHEHQTELRKIIFSGRVQIETAHHLRLKIQQTLAQVRETPLEQVSGQLLTTLSESVHRQVQDLEDIIQAAVGQAHSLQQIAQLEQVGAQAARRLQHVAHERGEQELMELERQAAEALKHIRSLEGEGQSHAVQKQALIEEAQAAREQVAELEETNAVNQREITRLEDEGGVTQGQRQALGRATEQLQQYLRDLRQRLAEPKQ
ncbi:hypothetical protein [Deinococcus sp. QL22]|uniref:hypothetical protein n=1 Tax=Deinococcus sp. QL22 TaxID=2939437 RepID=UPI0020171349|nr:hypothetical protein [Deinococcus sp. QL22]UQN10131.1 hypothetical protein M1R55_28505 [Deinococcus sp. QL22]